MRGVIENTFGFVGGELQAPDPENHQDETVAKDERTYFVDATDYVLSFNSQLNRPLFDLYSSCFHDIYFRPKSTDGHSAFAGFFSAAGEGSRLAPFGGMGGRRAPWDAA